MTKVLFDIMIKATPEPWKRPVPTERKGKMYDPSKLQKYKYAWKFKEAMRGRPKVQGPVEVELYFGYGRLPRVRIVVKESDYPGARVKTPDIDNLQKLIFDALQMAVVEDDKQIYKVSAVKVDSWAADRALGKGSNRKRKGGGAMG